MAVTNRDELIEYCLRSLGDPVIEVNVDPDQLEDRIDEAIEFYQTFHSDATTKTYLKHLVTADDVTNEYIPLPANVLYVTKLFPPASSSGASTGMFDVKYQMMLNDITDLQNFAGDLAYYEQMQQWLTLLDSKLTGQPQINFARRQNRLYIRGDFADKDITAGKYLIVECTSAIDPETFTSVYDDKFLKKYATQLIKKQWGANLSKFEGMQLPGGVSLNGRQLYEDAVAELEKLEETIILEYEFPADFFVG